MVDELSWARIGERVRESRASAGLSQQELADRIGLERSMISKLEKGDRRIDAMELTLIAGELDFPVTHFLAPVPEVVSRRTAFTEQSGAGDSAAARSAYRTEACLSQWSREVHQLIDLGVLRPNPLLRYPGEVSDPRSAREAAEWLRTRLGLDADPIESVADVCERAGQFLAVVPLPSDGASLVEGDVAVAVVGTQQEPGRRRSTAAHELGHMVLGDEFSTDLGVHASREERERMIEVFAAELLLPVSRVRAAMEGVAERDRRHTLVWLSATYRVSWGLALTQLQRSESSRQEEAGRLRAGAPTDVEFKDALGWKPQADLDSIRVSPRYASAVVEAVRRELITPTRAVEMMHGQITLKELTEE
ncbi:helix-turn-helix domain-containing protein [Nocardiopsis sp. LOL_012]|uniref:helix-turn-helix domain-containing protein n=1 Tax=Nocardiopsis sp. LOL_012 TaxID=3345409 RepID=UPI003A866159